jgi:hypothetical protein
MREVILRGRYSAASSRVVRASRSAVAFFGVELHRKATHVALGVSRPTSTATVQNRQKHSIFLSTSPNSLAFV